MICKAYSKDNDNFSKSKNPSKSFHVMYLDANNLYKNSIEFLIGLIQKKSN